MVVFLKLTCMVRLGMQIANVKHSRCEAKFGFRVWETKFGRVRRKTAPTGPGGWCGYSKTHNYLYIGEVRKPRQRGKARNCYLLKCKHIFGFYYNNAI